MMTERRKVNHRDAMLSLSLVLSYVNDAIIFSSWVPRGFHLGFMQLVSQGKYLVIYPTNVMFYFFETWSSWLILLHKRAKKADCRLLNHFLRKRIFFTHILQTRATRKIQRYPNTWITS